MATIGRMLLGLAVTAAIGVGIWGLAAPRGAHQPLPAAVGEAVSVPGGLIRVVRVQDVEYKMLPMTGPGMNMSAAHGGMPKIPKGYRRVAVEVLLYADSSSLEFRAPDFRVGRGDRKGVGPVGGFRREAVPAGVAVSQSLEFQVPETARELVLDVRGAERPILLGVPAGSRGHQHHDH
jgi:hypothetical protein